MRKLPVFFMLTLLLCACGQEEEEELPCTGGSDPDTIECSTGDAACELTCVCDDGEIDAGACLSGTCMSADAACTACPNFGLGEWTGDYCQ